MFRFTAILPAIAFAICEDEGGYTVCRGLDYVGDGDSGHKLDLYLPSAASDGTLQTTNTPAVVFAPGSGFKGVPYGSPHLNGCKDYPCKYLTEAGIACAAMAYRGSAWPAQHQDIRAAVRWVRGQGKRGEYGLGGKIGVHGGSSGASLAAHIWSAGGHDDEEFGADFARLGPFSNESAAVAAAAIYWPQYHLNPDDEPGCEFMEARPGRTGGSEDAYSKNSKELVELMNAQAYLESSTPPAYMVVGTNDTTVSPCNTVEAYTAAKAKGIDVNVAYVLGGGHGCAMRGPVWTNGCTDCHGPDPDVLDAMLTFFKSHLGTASTPAVNVV